jgi:hypothetical protein
VLPTRGTVSRRVEGAWRRDGGHVMDPTRAPDCRCSLKRVTRNLRQPIDRAGDLRCSFCDKTRALVEHIISGPGSGPNRPLICDECVALCQEIIAEEGDARRSAKES